MKTLAREFRSGRFTHNGHEDRALFDAIGSYHLIDFIVIESGDLARSQAQACRPESDVLGDVPGVKINVAVSPLSVLPFGSFEKSRPDKNDVAAAQEILVQGRAGYFLMDISGPQLVQGMILNIIMINTLLESLSRLG